jgi:hypothetical protein
VTQDVGDRFLKKEKHLPPRLNRPGSRKLGGQGFPFHLMAWQ